jgi:hypothetical protein
MSHPKLAPKFSQQPATRGTGVPKCASRTVGDDRRRFGLSSNLSGCNSPPLLLNPESVLLPLASPRRAWTSRGRPHADSVGMQRSQSVTATECFSPCIIAVILVARGLTNGWLQFVIPVPDGTLRPPSHWHSMPRSVSTHYVTGSQPLVRTDGGRRLPDNCHYDCAAAVRPRRIRASLASA